MALARLNCLTQHNVHTEARINAVYEVAAQTRSSYLNLIPSIGWALAEEKATK